MGKKQRKALKEIPKLESLKQINLNAAGIDIGDTEIWVCVPEDREEKSVDCFGVFTCDLFAIADWLKTCGVTTVAMESTSIYWVPLYEILENRGFEVFLVNPNDTRNIAGRKPALAPAAPRGAAGQGPIFWIASGFSNSTLMVCCARRFARPGSSSSCAIWFDIATICCTIALRTFCTCRKTCI